MTPSVAKAAVKPGSSANAMPVLCQPWKKIVAGSGLVPSQPGGGSA
jgi:hypothetical protein